MLHFDMDLLHLQPREDVAELRRAPLLPAGNSLNEQYARAQLHAGNEADIDAPPASRGALAAPIDEPLTTHWTRVLHHDLYGANDAAADPAAAPAAARRATVAIAYRVVEEAIDALLGRLKA